MENKKPCNITIGRFQPFTKGHLQMIKDGYDKNGYPCVIFMISNKKFDNKHPFSDNLIAEEMDIIRKNYNFIAETLPIDKADIVKIGNKLADIGYEAHLWLCGDDREAQFKRQAENPKYREQGHFPNNFTTYTGTGRTEGVSGTAVRNALKENNKAEFDKLVPKGVNVLFDKMKNEINNIKESIISLADFVRPFDENKSKHKNMKSLQDILLESITEELDKAILKKIDDNRLNQKKLSLLSIKKGLAKKTSEDLSLLAEKIYSLVGNYKTQDELQKAINSNKIDGYEEVVNLVKAVNGNKPVDDELLIDVIAKIAGGANLNSAIAEIAKKL